VRCRKAEYSRAPAAGSAAVSLLRTHLREMRLAAKIGQ
jgi:hypothetical protein